VGCGCIRESLACEAAAFWHPGLPEIPDGRRQAEKLRKYAATFIAARAGPLPEGRSERFGRSFPVRCLLDDGGELSIHWLGQREGHRIRRCRSVSTVRNTTQLLPGSMSDRLALVPDGPREPSGDVPSISRKVDRGGLSPGPARNRHGR